MTNITMRNETIIFLVLLAQFLVLFCHADSNITRDRMLRDGQDGDTLISDDKMFELGFFSPEGSTSRYVGIWYYNKIPRLTSVVWIANRDKPVSDQSGTMKIGQDGNLVIEDGRNVTVWSSGNVSVRVNNPMAKLHDSGNLVLSRSDDIDDANRAYWQSFNHPTDTFLPGMRFQFSESMGERRAFFSWKSHNDPSLGNYSMGVDPRGAPQVVIWRGSERRWRSGYWDNQKFNGVPSMSSILSFGFDFTREGGGNYSFKYIPPNGSDVMRFRLSWDGFEEQLKWNGDTQRWLVTQSQPASPCDHYNNCGNFGVCRNHSVNICSCLDGFEAKLQDQFMRRNWTGGCARKVPLGCPKNGTIGPIGDGRGDGFKPIRNVKLPDFGNMVAASNRVDCKDKCLRNCSCEAYAYEDGINCFLWTRELIDVQQFPSDGATLYLRLAASELGGRGKVSTAVIIIITVAGTSLLAIVAWIIWRIKSKPRGKTASSFIPHRNNTEAPSHDLTKSNEYSAELSGANEFITEGDQVNGPELPVFSFGYVASVTDNFSEENKLGKGGFGPVYKGKLPGGQEIAVKRLSRRSGQGIEEFKNEIKLIAKLQHRNLVRLLGCCVEGEEYMLVYEYMPNKSLDFFVFDSTKRELLDWRQRFAIIEGIARGLLYLHRDSRLRIIHRDLKASNILLDEDMIPKISDFGIARIFGGNENEANTVRVVGTYGYMSPEYAMEGLFSVKSDVYSFGVLLLEIVSGQRNTSFRTSEYSSLIGYAWKLWNEGRALEMVDPNIKESCSENEVLRCIHIGMLCVQDSALSRPTMSYVVVMLESEDTSLPIPRQPTYTSMRSSSVDIESYLENNDSATMNELTMTSIHGR